MVHTFTNKKYIKITITVQCTLYNVQCTLYRLHRMVFAVQCTAYTVHHTPYTVQRTAYTGKLDTGKLNNTKAISLCYHSVITTYLTAMFYNAHNFIYLYNWRYKRYI